MRLVYGNRGISATEGGTIAKPFRGKNLVIMVPQLQSNIVPGGKVPSRRDRSTDALLGTNGPILLKGPSTLNRRLVDTRAGVQLVGSLFEGEVALRCPRLSGQEDVVGLDHVVFDERVPGPPVECQVAWASRRVRPGVLDSPKQYFI